MISLFSEASRDVEKEQYDHNVHLANSMINKNVLPFVSSSQNQEQYDQYKALVSESLSAIASNCDLQYSEVSGLLDQKMSYIIEANQEKEAAFRDKEHFYIIDGRGKRIGGSYSSKESAQEAIARGEVKSSTGLRVIPASAFKTTSNAKGSAPETPQGPSESRVDPFKALASVREALHEGVNPLEWITESGSQPEEGVPSEHNSGPAPVHKEAQGAMPNSPIPDDNAGMGTTQHENVPTPEVDVSGGVPTTGPAEQPRVMPNNPLGPSMSKIKEEISRYNPDLPKERIESIAIKVASRYFVREESGES